MNYNEPLLVASQGIRQFNNIPQQVSAFNNGALPGGNPATMKSTQVSAFLAEVLGALDALDKSLGGLHEKIAPVMRGDIPCNSGDQPAPPDDALVPVANALRVIQRRVMVADAQVRSMAERVEA